MASVSKYIRIHIAHIRINSQRIHRNTARRRRQIAYNVCIPYSTHQYVALLSLLSATGWFANAIRQTEMGHTRQLTAPYRNGFITIVVVVIIIIICGNTCKTEMLYKRKRKRS